MSEGTEPIKIEQQDGVLVFAPQGDLGGLNLVNDQRLMYQMLEKVEEQGDPRVVIDMEAVTFADSTFLAVMVSVWKRISARGGRMVLSGVPDDIAEVLQYTKLNTLWKAYGSRSEAVAAIQG
jgi:anti-sigma B factor antagonist